MPSFSKKLNEVQISQVAEFVSESTRSSTMGGSVAAGFKPDDTKIEDCKPTDFHCFEQAFANISLQGQPADGARSLRQGHQDARPDRARLPPHRPRDRRRSALTLPRQHRPGLRRRPPQLHLRLLPRHPRTRLPRSLPRASSAPRRRAFCAQPRCPQVRVHRLPVRPRARTRPDDLHRLRPSPVAAHVRQAHGRPAELHGRRVHGELPVVVRHHVPLAEGERPIYPCNAVAERYKYYCYDLVTARILPKVNYNWKKASAWCRKSEKNWVKVCFQSMGRDASGYTRLDPGRILRICRAAGDMARECIYAAAEDMTYTDVNARRAKNLCNTAPAAARSYCWTGSARSSARSTASCRSARRAATRRRARRPTARRATAAPRSPRNRPSIAPERRARSLARPGPRSASTRSRPGPALDHVAEIVLRDDRVSAGARSTTSLPSPGSMSSAPRRPQIRSGNLVPSIVLALDSVNRNAGV